MEDPAGPQLACPGAPDTPLASSSAPSTTPLLSATLLRREPSPLTRPLATVSVPGMPLSELDDLVTDRAPATQPRIRSQTVSDTGDSAARTPRGSVFASAATAGGAGPDGSFSLAAIAPLRLSERAVSSGDLRDLSSSSCILLGGTPTAAGGGGGGAGGASVLGGALADASSSVAAAAAAAEGTNSTPLPTLQNGTVSDASDGTTPFGFGKGLQTVHPSAAAAAAGAAAASAANAASAAGLVFTTPGAAGSSAAAAAAGSGELPAGATPLPTPPPITNTPSATQQQQPAGTPTTQSAAARTQSVALPLAGGALTPELQSFAQFLLAEANPQEKVPTTDVIWRQTERDRV